VCVCVFVESESELKCKKGKVAPILN
jgi:hypothetical protein